MARIDTPAVLGNVLHEIFSRAGPGSVPDVITDI